MSQANVFVVDDDQDNLAFLSRIITKAGYEAQTFSDGAEALTALQDETPDLIILDIQMPRMNGFQVLKALREQEAHAQTPVVMLSAISAVTGDDYDPDVIESRYGVRPTAFINKGGQPAEVQALLEQYLNPQGTRKV